eukprot:scaffold21298_cov102-Skeletonema_marinoi.AAC.1
MELGRHYGEARATLQMRNLLQHLHNCLQNTSTPHIGCRPRITQDPPDISDELRSGLRVQRRGNSSARITEKMVR